MDAIEAARAGYLMGAIYMRPGASTEGRSRVRSILEGEALAATLVDVRGAFERDLVAALGQDAWDAGLRRVAP